MILNMIQRHNFFESFASIGRVDLVIFMSPESYYKENTMHTMNFFRRMSLNMIQLTSVVQAPWFRCVSEYQSVDLSIISFAFVFILLTSSLCCVIMTRTPRCEDSQSRPPAAEHLIKIVPEPGREN